MASEFLQWISMTVMLTCAIVAFIQIDRTAAAAAKACRDARHGRKAI